MSNTPGRPHCDGGERGHCHHPAVWRLKPAEDPDTARAWVLACGRHLAFAAEELSAGERRPLDLVRAVVDE